MSYVNRESLSLEAVPVLLGFAITLRTSKSAWKRWSVEPVTTRRVEKSKRRIPVIWVHRTYSMLATWKALGVFTSRHSRPDCVFCSFWRSDVRRWWLPPDWRCLSCCSISRPGAWWCCQVCCPVAAGLRNFVSCTWPLSEPCYISPDHSFPVENYTVCCLIMY